MSQHQPMLCSSAVKSTSPQRACYFTVLTIYSVFDFLKSISKICQQIIVELEKGGIINPICVGLTHITMYALDMVVNPKSEVSLLSRYELSHGGLIPLPPLHSWLWKAAWVMDMKHT